MDNPTNKPNLDPKVLAILAYITPIGWIAAVILNNPKDELASFHIRQALGVLLMGLAWSIPFVGWLVGIAGFVLWVIGFIYAIQSKMEEVPVLGAYFQDWFKSL